VEKLDQIPQLITDAVASYEGTRFVYCQLRELAESGLLHEICFFVENRPGRDVNSALDHVNRQILRAFERVGIELARPTRTVLLQRPAPQQDNQNGVGGV